MPRITSFLKCMLAFLFVSFFINLCLAGFQAYSIAYAVVDDGVAAADAVGAVSYVDELLVVAGYV